MSYNDLIYELRIVAGGAKSKRHRGLLERAADAIEELMAENKSFAESINEASDLLRKRKRWIPVTERLPIGGDKSGKVCENVWLLLDDGKVYPGWMNGLKEKVYYLDERDDHVSNAPASRVIAWQPKPEPPEEGSDG